jgi:hypothetical protein
MAWRTVILVWSVLGAACGSTAGPNLEADAAVPTQDGLTADAASPQGPDLSSGDVGADRGQADLPATNGDDSGITRGGDATPLQPTPDGPPPAGTVTYANVMASVLLPEHPLSGWGKASRSPATGSPLVFAMTDTGGGGDLYRTVTVEAFAPGASTTLKVEDGFDAAAGRGVRVKYDEARAVGHFSYWLADRGAVTVKLAGSAVSVELTSVHFAPAASAGEATGTFELSGTMGGPLP